MSLQLGPIRQVARPTSNIEQALGFYRDTLGLRLVAHFGNLAFFDLDGVRLLVEQAPEVGAASVLYFRVDDIHRARAELQERGVVFVDEPHVIFNDAAGTFGAPGEDEWMTFFEDPDGQLLALSARRRSSPAA